MSQIDRVAFAARVFTVSALTSLSAVAGTRLLPGALVIVAIALFALGLSLTTPLSQTAVAVVEGSAVAVAASVIFPAEAAVTPYLVIPALIGALDTGHRGLLRVVTTELAVFVLAWSVLQHTFDRQMAATGFTWLATAVGLGSLGVYLRTAVTKSASEASYRTAVALIRRLRALSARLRGGLDAVDIAEQMMETAEELIGVRHCGVLVVQPEGVVPLSYAPGTRPESLDWAQRVSAAVWAGKQVELGGSRTIIRLEVDGEVVGLLALEALRTIDPRQLTSLREALAHSALQLQAALLFGHVSEAASRRERQRIAREVHDGVAQDVASLGYLVDNLVAGAPEGTQRQQLEQLRGELTRVVTELRHSIFELRQVVPTGAGLGESLAAYARQVGSTSPLTVHVTLDERGHRLPVEVEHELLRISQQAMSNSRKHSGAENLWLRCTVSAPYAEVEVSDDGVRQHSPALDSQGHRIMHERAESIGAELQIDPPAPGRPGTRVRVRVGTANR